MALMLAALGAAGLAGLLTHPDALFPYSVGLGRLSLHSDRPFDAAAGRRVLADVAARLAASPIDDTGRHAIYIANAPWRRAIVMNIAAGAGGVNDYPLTRNVFLRGADIDQDRLIAPSGRLVAPPRTLAYYGAHEITHTLTAERLGPRRLLNHGLPQWVREGYADYVGLGGQADFDDLWRRYRAGDPQVDYRRSGYYARFRMLAGFFLVREGWSVRRLLESHMTEAQALAVMSVSRVDPFAC